MARKAKVLRSHYPKSCILELKRDISETEIDQLIESYHDWVLSNLMIEYNSKSLKSDNLPKKNKSGSKKLNALINNQCKNLFKQGDEMILKKRPDLAYLLKSDAEFETNLQSSFTTENSATKLNPQNNLPKKTPALKADQTVVEKSSIAGSAVELSIGGGNKFTLKLPRKNSFISDREPNLAVSNHGRKKTKNKNRHQPPKIVQIEAPAPRPERDRIKNLYQSNDAKALIPSVAANSASHLNLIPINPEPGTQQDNKKANPPSNSYIKGQTLKIKLSVERLSELLERQAKANKNLTVPGQSANNQHEQKTRNYFAQFGAFAQLENAKVQKKLLETKFSTLFTQLPLYIAEINGSGPRFFRIQTSSLSQKHIETLCNMMWPHRISCLVKRQAPNSMLVTH